MENCLNNLESLKLTTLNDYELEDTEGGIFGAFLLMGAAGLLGYKLGKLLFCKD